MPTPQAFGTWRSPLSLDMLCEPDLHIDGARILKSSGAIYTVESFSGNRTSIFLLSQDIQDDVKEVLPSPYSVGTIVHGYGGAAFTLDEERNSIIFSNAVDHGVYRVLLDSSTVEPVATSAHAHFADFAVHPTSGLVIAIRETHEGKEVKNELVVIGPGNTTAILVRGADFYSSPRFSPDGSRMCWLEWNHPSMPWTGSLLFVGDVHLLGGSLEIVNSRQVAGARLKRSISQPRWNSDSSLFFADDISGYWQLFRVHEDGTVTPVVSGLEETDHAGSEFKLGSSTYVFPNSETIALAYVKEGTSHLALVDIASGRFTPLACPLVDIQYDALSADGRGNVLVVGSSVIEGHGLYRMTTSSGQLDPLRRSHLRLGAQQISMPKAMQIPRTLPGTHGVIHGFLHLPYSPEYKGLENTRPPLVVHAHGGPTNHWRAGFSPQVQYLTSRGFAVFLLNYAGSTGYGKQYRELLNGRWGELDAADAAMAAEYLANVEKLVDGNRMSIEGPSAGGYLALATAALFPQTWRVSIVMCGISDVDSFSLTSHKFESQYSEHLVFGEQGDEMSQEERKARGIARSPIHHARNFNSAVLLIHGNTDTVVVPAQAKSMHESLQSVSNEVELILIPDWGHKLPAGDVLRATWAAQERLWMKHLVEPCV